jgi:hemolysin activation/secretion protein
VPIQSAYFLGSTPTLRGYYPLAATGDAFWRTRAELAHGSPAARFIVFSDMGWAGPRDEIERGRALLSAGAGFSTLDGLLRIDLARATRAPTGWRLHFYLNGAL